jgi:hypothetical protein
MATLDRLKQKSRKRLAQYFQKFCYTLSIRIPTAEEHAPLSCAGAGPGLAQNMRRRLESKCQTTVDVAFDIFDSLVDTP